MARIRSIKPEFPQSETIGRLSREARLLFIQLWTIVDDEGRSRAASRMLASLLYPYDEDAPSLIEAWLAELEVQRCLRRYEIEGTTYLEIINWLKHQKIDRPSKSRLPHFEPQFAKAREESRSLDADLGSRTKDLGSRKESISVKKSAGIGSCFETFWSICPRKVAKGAALRAYAKALQLPETTESLLLTGIQRYAEERRGDDPKFTKHPATWLNQRCWLDEPKGAFNGTRSLTGFGKSLEGVDYDIAPRPQLFEETSNAAVRLLPEG